MAKYHRQTGRMGRQRFRHRAEKVMSVLLAAFLEVTGAAEHLEIVRHGVSAFRLLRFAPCDAFPHDSFYEERPFPY